MAQATFLSILASLTIMVGLAAYLMLRRQQQATANKNRSKNNSLSTQLRLTVPAQPNENGDVQALGILKICPSCGLGYHLGQKRCPADNMLLQSVH